MALVWSRPERAADGWLRSCSALLRAARRCPRPLSRAAPCGRMWRRHPMDAGWLGAGARTVIGHWCAGRWIRPTPPRCWSRPVAASPTWCGRPVGRSEEHTSELQSQSNLVCRLLLEKKKKKNKKLDYRFRLVTTMTDRYAH